MLKNGKRVVNVWKVGSREFPATQDDIDSFKKDLEKAVERGDGNVVTHHAVELIQVEYDDEPNIFLIP